MSKYAALVALTVLWGSLALEDGSSLVQASVSRHGDTSNCTCLSWSYAYSKAGATCGQGHELDLVGIPGPSAAKIPQLADEFCKNYFYNLPDENFCQRTKFGADHDDGWCYVAAEACPQGEETQRDDSPHLRTKLKTKRCGAGDRKLSDAKFEDFVAHAKASKLEFGLMVQYAYPALKDVKIQDVQSWWGLPKDPAAPELTEAMESKLQAAVDSGETRFISSRSGHPPFGVVEGKKLYWINFSEANKRRQRNGEDVWAHKEEMNAYACVAGCEENEALF